MAEQFGSLPNGQAARLYTITGGGITAAVTDFGATLVRLMVPDRQGVMGDVVLGFSCVRDYLTHGGCLGATVGRNANRTGGAAMTISGRAVHDFCFASWSMCLPSADSDCMSCRGRSLCGAAGITHRETVPADGHRHLLKSYFALLPIDSYSLLLHTC